MLYDYRLEDPNPKETNEIKIKKEAHAAKQKKLLEEKPKPPTVQKPVDSLNAKSFQ